MFGLKPTRCKYCGISWDRVFAETAMAALGARLSWNPKKCPQAPAFMKRGPRGGIKYVREHVFEEIK